MMPRLLIKSGGWNGGLRGIRPSATRLSKLWLIINLLSGVFVNLSKRNTQYLNNHFYF